MVQTVSPGFSHRIGPFYAAFNLFLVPLTLASTCFILAPVTLIGTIVSVVLFLIQSVSYLLTFIVNPGVVLPRNEPASAAPSP